jgi:hypothetical protein
MTQEVSNFLIVYLRKYDLAHLPGTDNYEEAAALLAANKTRLCLRRDYYNPVDNDAIAVFAGSVMVGLMHTKEPPFRAVLDKLNSGAPMVRATADGVTRQGNKLRLAATLDVPVMVEVSDETTIQTTDRHNDWKYDDMIFAMPNKACALLSALCDLSEALQQPRPDKQAARRCVEQIIPLLYSMVTVETCSLMTGLEHKLQHSDDPDLVALYTLIADEQTRLKEHPADGPNYPRECLAAMKKKAAGLVCNRTSAELEKMLMQLDRKIFCAYKNSPEQFALAVHYSHLTERHLCEYLSCLTLYNHALETESGTAAALPGADAGDDSTAAVAPADRQHSLHAHPLPTTAHDSKSAGRHKAWLFMRDDGTKNEAETARQAQLFTNFLKQNNPLGIEIECKKGNLVTMTFLLFYDFWNKQRKVSRHPSGAAIYRFLTEDCSLRDPNTKIGGENKGFRNHIVDLVEKEKRDPILQKKVSDFVGEIISPNAQN